MSFLKLKHEYILCNTLQTALQWHTTFCLDAYFDQILDSDKIEVTCCHCGNPMKVKYDELVHKIHCVDCQDEVVTVESMTKLQQRLDKIQNRLLTFEK